MSSMGRSSGNTAPGEIGNDPDEYPEPPVGVRDVPRGRRAARMGSSPYQRTRRTGRAHRVLPAAGPAAPGSPAPHARTPRLAPAAPTTAATSAPAGPVAPGRVPSSPPTGGGDGPGPWAPVAP